MKTSLLAVLIALFSINTSTFAAYKFNIVNKKQAPLSMVGAISVIGGGATISVGEMPRVGGAVIATAVALIGTGFKKDLHHNRAAGLHRRIKAALKASNTLGSIINNKELVSILKRFDMPSGNMLEKAKFLGEAFPKVEKFAQASVSEITSLIRSDARRGLNAHLNSTAVNDKLIEILGSEVTTYNIDLMYAIYAFEFVEAFNKKFPRK